VRFPEAFIEQVREANNLVDIVGQYTQLKPSSGGYMGRCPFPDHQEKTASFSVSEVKQVYYCFGCAKKGNIFRFIQDLMGLGFPETIEFLANRAHISLPERTADPGADQQANRKKELVRISGLAAQYFAQQFQKLPAQHPARVYALEKRGLSQATIERFQIGYAGEEWDGLVQHLKKLQVSLALAEEARLIKARKEGQGYFDVFRDRLMFPIQNQMGETIAFGGRIIAQGEPKYLNSADTPIFIKGRVLYGLSQAAKHIRAHDQVIVVEGYMDVVALAQAGVENVVASMGTAFTPEHARIFARMTKNAIALFDGDSAGQNAAERSLPILLAADLHPKGLILPDGQDPDDFVRAKGADALVQLISQAPDLFSMVFGLWTRGYRGDSSHKVQIVDQLMPLFQVIQDTRLKSLYEGEVAQKLGVEVAWLRRSLQGKGSVSGLKVAKGDTLTKGSTGAPPQPSPPSATSVPETALETDPLIRLRGASRAELVVMGLMIKNKIHFSKIMDSGGLEAFTHPGVRTVLEKAALITGQHPEKFDKLASLLISLVDDSDLLFAYQTPEMLQPELDSIVQSEEDLEKEAKVLSDGMRRIREEVLKKQADELMAQIRTEKDTERSRFLMEQLMAVQKDRSVLNLNKELN